MHLAKFPASFSTELVPLSNQLICIGIEHHTLVAYSQSCTLNSNAEIHLGEVSTASSKVRGQFDLVALWRLKARAPGGPFRGKIFLSI